MTVAGFGVPGNFQELIRNLEEVGKGRYLDESLAVVDDREKALDPGQLEQRVEAKVLDLLRQKREVNQGVPGFKQSDQIDKDLCSLEDRFKVLVKDSSQLHRFIAQTREEVRNPTLDPKYASLRQREIVWLDRSNEMAKGVLGAFAGSFALTTIALEHLSAAATTQLPAALSSYVIEAIPTIGTLSILALTAYKSHQVYQSIEAKADKAWNATPQFKSLVDNYWSNSTPEIRAKVAAEATPEQLLEYGMPSSNRSGHAMKETMERALWNSSISIDEANFWVAIALRKPVNAQYFVAMMQRFGSDLVENPARIVKFLLKLPPNVLKNPAVRLEVEKIAKQSTGLTWEELSTLDLSALENDPFCKFCGREVAAARMDSLLRNGDDASLAQASIILKGPHGPALIPLCRIDLLAKIAIKRPWLFIDSKIDGYSFWANYGMDASKILTDPDGYAFLKKHPFHALLVVASLNDKQRQELRSKLAALAVDLKLRGSVNTREKVKRLLKLSAQKLDTIVTQDFQKDSVKIIFSDGTQGFYPKNLAVNHPGLRPLMGFNADEGLIDLRLMADGAPQGVPLTKANTEPFLLDLTLGSLGGNSVKDNAYKVIEDLMGD